MEKSALTLSSAAACSIILLVTHAATARAYAAEWSLLPLMMEGRAAADFSPDRDFRYLPRQGDKGFFESIDDLSALRRSPVREYICHYQTAGRQFLRGGVLRARRYMDVVDAVFEKHGDVPAGLKLLPLLESGFNPHAVSRSNAVGPWQFMSGTARLLGLKNNSRVDERKSIHRSTEAALKHLQSLYRTFNSWELALAAYNGGAGYVKRAMQKSGAKDFWELREKGALREETSEYVPRFMALSVLYNNPDLFMLDDITPVLTAKTRLVEFEYPADLRKIAAVSGVSLELLRAYNPEIRKNITPPGSIKYSLLVPEEGLERLARNMDRVYVMKLSRIATCRVKKGDTLRRIARRYQVPAASIMLLNDLANPGRLRRGQEILIPQ